jgi:hypothetical protein
MIHFARPCLFFVLAIHVAGCGQDLKTFPQPGQLFREREKELREYVSRINAEKVDFDDKQGYAIPQFLIDAGARYVKKKDGCIVISFGFLPTDAVPELWYCQVGFDPIPKGLVERKQMTFFQWEQLAPDWGFCKWDQ